MLTPPPPSPDMPAAPAADDPCGAHDACARPRTPLQDAYLPWALATQLSARGDAVTEADAQPVWTWLLLQLRSGCNVRNFSEAARLAGGCIRLPGHYASPPRKLAGTRCCTALVSRSFLDALQGVGVEPAPVVQGLCACIERFEVGYQMKPWPAVPTPDAGKVRVDRLPVGSRRVVVGVIDDGLAFANARFCSIDQDGVRHTRLLSLWDQDGQPDGASPGLYGRCLTITMLDDSLAAGRIAGSHGYDEDAVYVAARYAAVRHRITHGTHVLDLACGADPAAAVGMPMIVAVQPPGPVLEDTSCSSSTVFLLDAVWHVLAEADRAAGQVGGEAPGSAVINLSMGNIAGPHNGSSIFEQALDEVIQARSAGGGCCHIVLPSGNSHLARCHAWGEIGPGSGPMEVDWHVQSGDGTPSFVELWFCDPEVSGKPVDIGAARLEITPPRCGKSISIRAGEDKDVSVDGTRVGIFSLHQAVANGNLGMGLLALAPTEPVDGRAAAPAGRWKIAVYNDGKASLACGIYVQRDDVAFGRRGSGRQSILTDGSYRRLDRRGGLELRDLPGSFVRRVGTLNGLATGQCVDIADGSRITPGGEREEARYASKDLPVPRHGGGPRSLVRAITEDSPVLHGVLAAGTRSGSVVSLSGTSMAAPQQVRELAAACLHELPVDEMEQPGEAEDLHEADDLLKRSQRRRGA